jgi:hypothetical protein
MYTVPRLASEHRFLYFFVDVHCIFVRAFFVVSFSC